MTAYWRAFHRLQSATLSGTVNGPSALARITPSDVEQKLLVPVFLSTGVAIATNSMHDCFLHTPVSLKRYPDFVHHALAVQLSFPRVSLISPACSDDSACRLLRSG